MSESSPQRTGPTRLHGLDPAKLLASAVRSGVGSEPSTARAAGTDADPVQPEVPGYELLGSLGRGGMGEVYLARQLSLDREVALKCLRADRLTQEWFLERLEREARTLARLRHPNLVTVHDFVRLPAGGAAVVMEFVPGGNLRERLVAVGPGGLPLEDVLRLAREIAGALGVAHAAGMIHRDVKPENILLDASGSARVTDFGMALERGPVVSRLTDSGAVLGTPGYLAPEQCVGASLDARTDLFAFGVLVYEMFTGRLPLGAFPDAAELRPDIPGTIRDLIRRSLQTEPAARPESMSEWIHAVENLRRASTPAISLDDGAIPSPTASEFADEPKPTSELSSDDLSQDSRSRGSSAPSRRLWLAGAAGLVVLGAGYAAYRSLPRSGGTLPDAPVNPGRAGVTPGGTEPAAGASWETIPWPTDLARATVHGSWFRDEAHLESTSNLCVLGLPLALPRSFDVRFAFTRREGKNSVALFLGLPEGWASCEFDAWDRGLAGIQSIGGRSLKDLPSFRFPLVNGRRYLVELRVRGARAEVWIDDTQRGESGWEGQRLGVVSPWAWPERGLPPGLAIGSYHGATRFEPLLWRTWTARPA